MYMYPVPRVEPSNKGMCYLSVLYAHSKIQQRERVPRGPVKNI